MLATLQALGVMVGIVWCVTSATGLFISLMLWIDNGDYIEPIFYGIFWPIIFIKLLGKLFIKAIKY